MAAGVVVASHATRQEGDDHRTMWQRRKRRWRCGAAATRCNGRVVDAGHERDCSVDQRRAQQIAGGRSGHCGGATGGQVDDVRAEEGSGQRRWGSERRGGQRKAGGLVARQ